MRLGLSIAEGGNQQPADFWSAPAYLAANAAGGGSHGPAAILDFTQDRHALTVVPAAAIPSASITALTTLAAKSLTDVLAFTRPGTASYIDADGLLRTAAADQPRFDYTHGRRQLLLEGPGTNLLIHSNDFTNGAWLKPRVSVAHDEAGPSGLPNDACSVVAAPQAGSHYFYQVVPFSSNVYTLSLRVKYANHRWFYVRLYDGSTIHLVSVDLLNGVVGNTSGTATGTMMPDGNGFFRVAVAATVATGNPVSNVLFGFNQTGAAAVESWTPAGTEKVIIHGAQLEAGSHPSSYIPTAGTTVTRPADKAQLTEPVAALLRGSEVSVLLQGAWLGRGAGFPGVLLGAAGGGYICTINATGAYLLAGAPSLTLSPVSPPLPAFGVIVGWDADLFKGCYNASAVQARSGTQETDLSAVYLGRAASGTAPSGWYDQLVIWPFRMTDADLQAKAVSYA